MKQALWFSRHLPTADQLSDAEKIGFTIVNIPDGMEMGARNLNNKEEVRQIMQDLIVAAEKSEAAAIFGAFPSPILEYCHYSGYTNGEPIHLYSSWNVNRAKEGEKPTFAHLAWCQIGELIP